MSLRMASVHATKAWTEIARWRNLTTREGFDKI